MNIIAVDDERHALNTVEDAIKEVMPESSPSCFQSPKKALEYARENRVDVAFLDIEMGSMNGLELAKSLKEIYGSTNIIFVTGYSEHALDAFALSASGYICKPVSAAAVGKELEQLRHPVKVEKKANGLIVKTFGNFEVYVNGQPLHFPRSKAKELFAYLIHKQGSGCTNAELMAVLYEDKEPGASLKSQMQTVIATMVSTMKQAGYGDVVVKKFNNLSVDASKIDCDYYRFLKWDTDAVNAYTGEYMSNYSWAEFTAGYLDEKLFNSPQV